jgi:polyphosphate kinase
MPRTTLPTPSPLALDEAIIKKFFVQPEDRFFNRELSWLSFNTRVLQEASNPHIPLLERLKFLSISAANLDEFYMVRVAGLKAQVRSHISTISSDGQTPKQQLEKIQENAGMLIHAQQHCWVGLKRSLQKEGIRIVTAKEITDREKTWLRHYFEDEIFPLLTPIAVDPSHPFPFVPNLGMVQVFELTQPRKKSKKQIALIPFPQAQSRFIKIEATKNSARYMLLEELICLCFDILFPGYEALHTGVFRIVRDSDLEIEEEAEDLMRNLDSAVKKRRHGRVVRIKTGKNIAAHLLQFMLDHLPADAHDVIEVQDMVGLSQIDELYALARPDLKFTPFKVRYPERMHDVAGDCFAAISAKDFVIHHPFESFDVVVQFLNQAADDPAVVSIKQTLYRTSKDSPIVQALIRAAENGKAVTALVELKARFDEEANIRWARDMERAGVQVVYGFIDLKTHAKISLVVRRERGKLKSYAHFGTGNYHPITAKIYTDLSFFTCDNALCHDAAYVFNYITGYSKPRNFEKLSVAPLSLRKKILTLIGEEIAHAKAGRPAAIWAKMNALVDPEVIDALYNASQAGVQIELIVRGICALKPGIAGFSENIRVKSIVGRFLEHTRICAFGGGHGLPSPAAKLFISSADWMGRNFDRRVEILVPIENPTVHAQILDQIMVANIKDERQSWILKPDGSYGRHYTSAKAFAAHDYFMNNPSLSGRGKALQELHAPASAPPAAKPSAARGRKKQG